MLRIKYLISGAGTSSLKMLSIGAVLFAGAALIAGVILSTRSVHDTAVIALSGCPMNAKMQWDASVASCAPRSCGRLQRYGFASPAEVSILRDLAEKGFSIGQSSGGASVLDVHRGAVSKGSGFIDLFAALAAANQRQLFNATHLSVYGDVSRRVAQLARETLLSKPKPASPSRSARRAELTSPTFFSRMDGGVSAVTVHDEYWHSHVDLDQYGSFVVTGLLYLADHGSEFSGGEFVFEGESYEVTIEPKRGMLLLFTSGPENPHRVERVTSGTRYALTMALTCSPDAAIPPDAFLGRAWATLNASSRH